MSRSGLNLLVLSLKCIQRRPLHAEPDHDFKPLSSIKFRREVDGHYTEGHRFSDLLSVLGDV